MNKPFQRRSFLTAAAAVVGGFTPAALAATAVLADDNTAKRQFTALQTFTVKDLDKRKQLVHFLGKGFIPALNTYGIKKVGVFLPIEKEEKYQLNVFVVIPYTEPAGFLALRQYLLDSKDFRKNGAELFDTNSKNPLYTDCSAALLWNFPFVPVIETPDLGKDRVFQLRRYRSFNIERHTAKMDMFQSGGELKIFRETGLNPIFFGDSLFGNKMPNITYMIGSESLEAHDAAWKKFIAHPDWQALKGQEKYADTATEIDRVILRPSEESQI